MFHTPSIIRDRALPAATSDDDGTTLVRSHSESFACTLVLCGRLVADLPTKLSARPMLRLRSRDLVLAPGDMGSAVADVAASG